MLENYKGATREERFQNANTELLEDINTKLGILIDLLKAQNAPAVITEEKKEKVAKDKPKRARKKSE